MNEFSNWLTDIHNQGGILFAPKVNASQFGGLLQLQTEVAAKVATTTVVSCDLHHRQLTGWLTDGTFANWLVVLTKMVAATTKGDNFVAVSTRFNRFKAQQKKIQKKQKRKKKKPKDPFSV